MKSKPIIALFLLLSLVIVAALGAGLPTAAQGDPTATTPPDTPAPTATEDVAPSSTDELTATAVPAATATLAPDDPRIVEDPADNACYTGGVMEGKCDWPTQAEEDWAWNCGWYVARFHTGVFEAGQVPTWCDFFFFFAEDGGDDGEEQSTCYTLAVPLRQIGMDFRLLGPFDTMSNLAYYETGDGSCSGDILDFDTVVTAADSVEAADKCGNLDSDFNVAVPFGPSNIGRDDLWVCLYGAT